MSFIFFIILFANIFILEYSTLKNCDSLDWKNKDAHILNYTEKKIENEGKIVKRQLLQIINNTNLSTRSNLKFNIFDKMLSEEMLSIKQHFYEKDSSHSPSVQITVQSNVATPTLQVKQMWPIKNLFLKTYGNVDNVSKVSLLDEKAKIFRNASNQNTSNQLKEEDIKCKNASKNQKKHKIVGLRSLSESSALKLCGCMKNNPSHTCNHLCTGFVDDDKDDSICTHTDKDVQTGCISTKLPKSPPLPYTVYPFYVTYPYFWELSTYTVRPYYHPNPINEIKISKTKRRRKNKKPTYTEEIEYKYIPKDNNEIYYEYNEEDPNYFELYEEIYKMSKSTTSAQAYELHNVEYVENTPKKLHYNRDVFVNDIVDDLKKDYGDIFIKDCYCSSSGNSVLNTYLLQCVINVFIYIPLKCLV